MKQQGEETDGYINTSRKDRLKFINETHYDGPYLEPYNICLFWNAEYSKASLGELVYELGDLEKRMEMAMQAYRDGRGWGHY
jgi:hypothetical protein